jgi:DNA polymerase
MEEFLRGLGIGELILKTEDKKKALDIFADSIKDCKKCRLHTGRKQVVFGTGNPYARVMFVGEAPGMEEDIKGYPFVGKAGRLLTDILKDLGKDRERDVYIANVIKCRPPNNRDPMPDEIRACVPYLDFQVKIISPRVILCVGRFSMYYILNRFDQPKISEVRGKMYISRYGIPAFATYHPAAALRNPSLTDLIREDIKRVFEFAETS